MESLATSNGSLPPFGTLWWLQCLGTEYPTQPNRCIPPFKKRGSMGHLERLCSPPPSSRLGQTWMAVYWRASNKRMRTNPPIFCFFFQHTHQHGIEAISATRGWDRVIFASQIAGRLLCHCCYSPLLLILFHQNNNQR